MQQLANKHEGDAHHKRILLESGIIALAILVIWTVSVRVVKQTMEDGLSLSNMSPEKLSFVDNRKIYGMGSVSPLLRASRILHAAVSILYDCVDCDTMTSEIGAG